MGRGRQRASGEGEGDDHAPAVQREGWWGGRRRAARTGKRRSRPARAPPWRPTRPAAPPPAPPRAPPAPETLAAAAHLRGAASLCSVRNLGSAAQAVGRDVRARVAYLSLRPRPRPAAGSPPRSESRVPRRPACPWCSCGTRVPARDGAARAACARLPAAPGVVHATPATHLNVGRYARITAVTAAGVGAPPAIATCSRDAGVPARSAHESLRGQQSSVSDSTNSCRCAALLLLPLLQIAVPSCTRCRSSPAAVRIAAAPSTQSPLVRHAFSPTAQLLLAHARDCKAPRSTQQQQEQQRQEQRQHRRTGAAAEDLREKGQAHRLGAEEARAAHALP